MAIVEIDSRSGFCFGVVTAIHKAEEELNASGRLFCLGDIVHNNDEVERLSSKGMETITHEALENLKDVKVLLRAHGEPPATYEVAKRNNIQIIDATCPVVLRLQQRIKAAYDTANGSDRPQIVIYGKAGHAEVNGLVGQTGGTAIVVEDIDGLDKLDFSRPIFLYSQTTKSVEGFNAIINEIKIRMTPGVEFKFFDTICRQVASRVDHLKEFASKHEVVIFVAGIKSSNGKILYNHCLEANPRSHLVPNEEHILPEWLDNANSIGICGATSTPSWLMERVRDRVNQLIGN